MRSLLPRLTRSSCVLIVSFLLTLPTEAQDSVDEYAFMGEAHLTPTAIPCPAGAVSESLKMFVVPTLDASPGDITAGPDCAVWFTEGRANKIGRITPAGAITEFAIPGSDSFASSITTGPDGALWFTYGNANKVGRITTAGQITEFDLPTTRSFQIAAGPDGNLWFTSPTANAIGRITPSGVITVFPVPPLGTALSEPTSIAAGADGNLWFVESLGRIGRITTAGAVTLFATEPECCAKQAWLTEITAGPDGNMWFAEAHASAGQQPLRENTIGRITPSGIITLFPLDFPPFPDSATIIGIATGADGALWFTHRGGVIGRMTTNGVVSEVTRAVVQPISITSGPDGNIWFTDPVTNRIGRLAVTPLDPPPARSRRRPAIRP